MNKPKSGWPDVARIWLCYLPGTRRVTELGQAAH
jgi:hypothetical protein